MLNDPEQVFSSEPFIFSVHAVTKYIHCNLSSLETLGKYFKRFLPRRLRTYKCTCASTRIYVCVCMCVLCENMCYTFFLKYYNVLLRSKTIWKAFCRAHKNGIVPIRVVRWMFKCAHYIGMSTIRSWQPAVNHFLFFYFAFIFWSFFVKKKNEIFACFSFLNYDRLGTRYICSFLFSWRLAYFE